MQEKLYDCDGGALAIEMSGSEVCIQNEAGDGTYSVFVYDKNELPRLLEENLSYVTRCYFKEAHVLDYDYLHNFSKENIEQHTLFTLSGLYGIYRKSGDIYLSKWED